LCPFLVSEPKKNKESLWAKETLRKAKGLKGVGFRASGCAQNKETFKVGRMAQVQRMKENALGF